MADELNHMSAMELDMQHLMWANSRQITAHHLPLPSNLLSYCLCGSHWAATHRGRSQEIG